MTLNSDPSECWEFWEGWEKMWVASESESSLMRKGDCGEPVGWSALPFLFHGDEKEEVCGRNDKLENNKQTWK